jgi:hypothetical protein
MSGWNTDMILADRREAWNRATADWTPDQLREKLAEITAAIYPIHLTLAALIDNPDVPHGGMNVSSDLVPLQFDSLECEAEYWGAKYNVADEKFDVVPIDFSAPTPGDYHTQSVDFPRGKVLHDDYTILDVWQYATAASIHCGGFDASDVRKLCEALRP